MRQKISVVLIAIALLLLLLPGIGTYSFNEKPDELLKEVIDEASFISVDQVAIMLNAEETSYQLIDLRSEEEFHQFSIPGSINIPFDQFFKLKPETWLYNKSTNYIFYSNGDVNPAYALVLARGLGYKNCQVLKGGLNEWYDKIMNSKFEGEKISARENALFGNRFKARQFFTEINSLPDSLKIKFAESKRQAEKSLDGGCN